MDYYIDAKVVREILQATLKAIQACGQHDIAWRLEKDIATLLGAQVQVRLLSENKTETVQ